MLATPLAAGIPFALGGAAFALSRSALVVTGVEAPWLLAAVGFVKLGFDLADQDWRDVVFRLWVERVIHYTLNQVPAGYDAAIAYLEGTIEDFESGG